MYECVCVYVCVYMCMGVSICVCGARCSSVVKAFAHGAMGRQIDPSWWTIELFLVPASATQLV